MWGEEYIQDYLTLDVIQGPRFSKATVALLREWDLPTHIDNTDGMLEILQFPISGPIVRVPAPIGLDEYYEAICLQCRDRSKPYKQRRSRGMRLWAERHFCKRPYRIKWDGKSL